MKSILRFVVLHGCWLIVGAMAFGFQGRCATPPANLPATNTSNTRRIVPNDALTIRVVGQQDCQIVAKRVGDDGSITFPFIGRIEVKGRTTSEVEAIVREKLMDGYFRQPQV